MKNMKEMAKKLMLETLSKSMSEDMYKDKLSPKKEVQKVVVASDSKEGLMKGLSKAEEILKKKGLLEESSEEEKCEGCMKAPCECEEYEEEESEE